MNYKYVRFQGRELSENTRYPMGIFSMCWSLIQDDVMEEEDAELYKEIIACVLPDGENIFNEQRRC